MQLQGTNTYLLGTGPEKILIDTGAGDKRWAELVSSLVNDWGILIRHVLLTHWHGDHTGGVPDMVRLYPNLKDDIFKCDPAQGQQDIVEEQIFTVPGVTVRAIHTKGHTADHMCFLMDEERALFTGDTLLGNGANTAVENMSEYMTSLRKIQERDCHIAYPGHGDKIPDLTKKLKQEVDRCLQRESRVLMTLRKIQKSNAAAGDRGKGGATTTELVNEMFGSLSASVRESAIQPAVKEMLMKLAAEKKVGFELKGGQKRWFAKSQVVA